jgi:phage terminase Nu1 subunit (DNA packaging protein)
VSNAQTFPLDTICKLLDLTPQRVAQLVNMGVIPRKERGRYELVPVVRGYIHYLRERAIKGDAQAGGDDYAAHRARLTKAKADMAEMEREQMANALIPAVDVERAWIEVVSNMRAKLLAIPTTAAADAQAAATLAEAKQVLKEKINEALAELSEMRVEVVNPLRASDDQDGSGKGAQSVGTAAGPDDL